MRALGVVRKLDELGRVVIPVDCRRELGITFGDPLEISVNGEYLVLKKYVPKCVFCKSDKDVVEVKGKHICRNCLANLKEMTMAKGA